MAQKTKNIYDIIKKQNGETFAKTIREYDNGIFDIPNLPEILKYAGRDANPIKEYIESLKDIKVEEADIPKNTFELLKEAGYSAYYADTVQKQNSIRKYFAESEELCTFSDAYRYQKYHIINCIKDNVDDIKRENFSQPRREDEYGTSVISIQILKKGGFISIKNRYNHTVTNPDNTFNSNPDNIVKGLGAALMNDFNVDFGAQAQELPDNYTIINNQIVRYIYEVNNTYFGKNFYAKDGAINTLSCHHTMMDYFIFDNKNSEIIDPAGVVDDKKIKNKEIITDLAKNRMMNGKFLIAPKNLSFSEALSHQLEVFRIKYDEATVIMTNIITEKNKDALWNIFDQILKNELYNFAEDMAERFPKEEYARFLPDCLPSRSSDATSSIMHYIEKFIVKEKTPQNESLIPQTRVPSIVKGKQNINFATLRYAPAQEK